MALADNRYGFRPLYDDAPVLWMPVKTTQTIAVGDPVILDTGQIAIAVSGSSAAIVGVAAGPCASLTAGTLIPVWCYPETLFVGRQDDTTSLAAGTELDLSGTTGEFQLDGNSTSQDIMMLWGEYDVNEADGIGKRWIVRINKHTFAQID